MGEQLTKEIFSIAAALVGVATIAVLVSKSANTSSVIGAAASGFAKDIGAALAPVSGSGGIGSLPSLGIQ